MCLKSGLECFLERGSTNSQGKVIGRESGRKTINLRLSKIQSKENNIGPCHWPMLQLLGWVSIHFRGHTYACNQEPYA